MAFADRLRLIKKIEELRESRVICYLTSLRPNVSAQMAEDAVRVFFDLLATLPSRKIDKLDIFLCSNGGSGTVPPLLHREDLRLKVANDVSQDLEDAIWHLYRQYEDEFDNLSPFYPPADLVPLATATNPNQTTPVSREYDLLITTIESGRLSSRYTVRKRVSLLVPQPAQRVMWEDVLAQGWQHTPLPEGDNPPQGH